MILVRRETVPDDIHGMWVAQGVLTATGGMTSHAAVVGRQMGKPSVVGAGSSRSTSRRGRCASRIRPSRKATSSRSTASRGEVKLAQVASQPSEILQVVAGKLKPQRFADLSTLQPAALLVGQVPSDGRARQRRSCPIRRSSPTRLARAALASAAPSTCSSAKAASRSCSA